MTHYDTVDLQRSQILYTKITHSYLLTKDDAPFCIPCNEHFIVKHFLLKCHDLAHIHSRLYPVNSLKDLFTSTPSDKIIYYLKEIGLYSKIETPFKIVVLCTLFMCAIKHEQTKNK